MSKKIELNEKQLELFLHNGTVYQHNVDVRYMFFPFWIKECADNTYEMYQLGNLPKELKQAVRGRKESIVGSSEENQEQLINDLRAALRGCLMCMKAHRESMKESLDNDYIEYGDSVLERAERNNQN